MDNGHGYRAGTVILRDKRLTVSSSLPVSMLRSAVFQHRVWMKREFREVA